MGYGKSSSASDLSKIRFVLLWSCEGGVHDNLPVRGVELHSG